MSRNKVLLARRRHRARQRNMLRCRACLRRFNTAPLIVARFYCFDCEYRRALGRAVKAVKEDWDRRALEHFYLGLRSMEMEAIPLVPRAPWVMP